MLIFAILVFLSGAALGWLVRLPALIGIVCGFVLAILLAAALSTTSLGGPASLVTTLLVSIVGLQAGYGCGVVMRGLLGRRAVSAAPREDVRSRPRGAGREVMSALGDNPLDRASQDWSSRNQP